MDHSLILRIRGLSKRFLLHESSKTIEALQDLSLDASAGKILILVGASGSGKSSVLKCIYRTYQSDAGTIDYYAEDGSVLDLVSATERDIIALRRREIRYVSQFLTALPRKSAMDVVARPLLELGESVEKSQDAARDMLAQIGLPGSLWEIPPHTFSGGERQLVNLARALIVKPRLLLLDEPVASLDPASTEQVVRSVESLKNQGMALIGIFHDEQIVERIADETLIMGGGITWNQT